MATRVVRTAGQVAFEDFQALHPSPLPWNESSLKAQWEAFAAKHNIQPIVEDVPDAPPTDGELMRRCIRDWSGHDVEPCEAKDIADAFLRDRDGEPLPVTEKLLSQWNCDEAPTGLAYLPWLAAKINRHRGVRPTPIVTAEMWKGSHAAFLKAEGNVASVYCQAAADYLNAELAKQAGK